MGNKTIIIIHKTEYISNIYCVLDLSNINESNRPKSCPSGSGILLEECFQSSEEKTWILMSKPGQTNNKIGGLKEDIFRYSKIQRAHSLYKIKPQRSNPTDCNPRKKTRSHLTMTQRR